MLRDVTWAIMQPLTVPRADFAGNNLMHDAGQIMNSHVKDLIRCRFGKVVWRG